MKIFIWKRVERMSFNYHNEGGVVAIAVDLAAARAMIAAEQSECGALATEPDYELGLKATLLDPVVLWFPDAGCC